MRFVSVQLVLAASALGFVACSSKAPVEPVVPSPPVFPSEEIVQLRFDTLQCPASLSPDDTLILRVTGYGPDSCHGFRWIEDVRANTAITLTAVGAYRRDEPCYFVLMHFEVPDYRIPPPFAPGEMRIVALQPDGSTLERVVNVSVP